MPGAVRGIKGRRAGDGKWQVYRHRSRECESRLSGDKAGFDSRNEALSARRIITIENGATETLTVRMQPRLNAIRVRGATQPKPEANSLSHRPGNLLSISHGVNDYGFVLWLRSAFVVYRWSLTSLQFVLSFVMQHGNTLQHGFL